MSTADDDMTPEEFDAAWEKTEPVEVVIPEGGIKRSRPTTGTYTCTKTHNYWWSPEHGLQERT